MGHMISIGNHNYFYRMVYILHIFFYLLVIVGIIVLGIFLGKMDNSDFYGDYDMAWAFYYFLIGWFFTISAFVTSLIDRS